MRPCVFTKAPFRSIWAALTFRPLVALIDFDGEVSVRIARRNVLGTWSAKRCGFGIRTVTLLPNGKVGNGSYVSSWIGLSGVLEEASQPVGGEA